MDSYVVLLGDHLLSNVRGIHFLTLLNSVLLLSDHLLSDHLLGNVLCNHPDWQPAL